MSAQKQQAAVGFCLISKGSTLLNIITSDENVGKGKEGGRFGPSYQVTVHYGQSPGCMATQAQAAFVIPSKASWEQSDPQLHSTLQIQHSWGNNYVLRSMLGAVDMQISKAQLLSSGDLVSSKDISQQGLVGPRGAVAVTPAPVSSCHLQASPLTPGRSQACFPLLTAAVAASTPVCAFVSLGHPSGEKVKVNWKDLLYFLCLLSLLVKSVESLEGPYVYWKEGQERLGTLCVLWFPSGRRRNSSTRSNTSWVVESKEGKPIIPGRRRKQGESERFQARVDLA